MKVYNVITTFCGDALCTSYLKYKDAVDHAVYECKFYYPEYNFLESAMQQQNIFYNSRGILVKIIENEVKEAELESIDVRSSINSKFPLDQGTELAQFLIDKKVDFSKIELDFTRCAPSTLTSGFFNNFLNLIFINNSNDLVNCKLVKMKFLHKFQYDIAACHINKFKPPVIYYDCGGFAHDLPAGWNLNGKPIIMKELIDDPIYVKSYFDLTKAQQFALVKARIVKLPLFKYLGLNQSECLDKIIKSTDLGTDIVNYEINFLHNILSVEIDNYTRSLDNVNI